MTLRGSFPNPACLHRGRAQLDFKSFMNLLPILGKKFLCKLFYLILGRSNGKAISHGILLTRSSRNQRGKTSCCFVFSNRPWHDKSIGYTSLKYADSKCLHQHFSFTTVELGLTVSFRKQDPNNLLSTSLARILLVVNPATPNSKEICWISLLGNSQIGQYFPYGHFVIPHHAKTIYPCITLWTAHKPTNPEYIQYR